MFERFTDRGRRVVVLAQEAARKMGSPAIESEHLLLGIVDEGESFVARRLREKGMTREAIVSLSKELCETEGVDAAQDVPFSIPAKTAIAMATEESHSAGHEFVTPEHLLLGLLSLEEAGAARVLRHSEGFIAGLREEVLVEITDDPRLTPGAGRCTKCGASIETYGKVQEVELKVVDGKAINVYAYFCGECKSTYGLVKGPGEDAEDGGG